MSLRPLAAALALTLLPALPAAAAPKRSASMALAKLLEDDWNHELHESPTYASIIGDRRWNGRWDDLSAEAIEARRKHDREMVKRLDALLAPGLGADAPRSAGGKP